VNKPKQKTADEWHMAAYISKESRLLKFYYVSDTSAASSKGIFAAATKSTNQKNKAGSMSH